MPAGGGVRGPMAELWGYGEWKWGGQEPLWEREPDGVPRPARKVPRGWVAVRIQATSSM